MILRPRQKTAVEKCLAVLKDGASALLVAPTGSGKTIMLSEVNRRMLGAGLPKTLVLQHRDELTSQNVDKFRRVAPEVDVSIYNAERKSWNGDVVFAMEPTLRRQDNLEHMPPFGMVTVDEAQHVGADGYKRILERAREANPAVRLFGVTATPRRGDGKGLDHAFATVADQITVRELIASGHLVRPRTFVIDLGVRDALKKVRKTAADYDMVEVESIMNRRPITDKVIENWREKAGDRQTVVFCSTVAHATDVRDAYRDHGVSAEVVHGELPSNERRALLAAYGRGEFQVLTNVFVLSEGWDDPPTSCVVLLRPSSYKSTYIQMIGRGLRITDPELHPGVVKHDCVVLDFGASTLMHGTIEQDVDLEGRKKGDEEFQAPTKTCPGCGEEVPAATRVCPGCGHEFVGEPPEELPDFVMSEIDLLARSNFRWVDLFDDDLALMATGFEAWGGVFCLDGDWHAVGGKRGAPARYLGAGERIVAMSLADDWLNEHETDEAAHKSRRWLDMPATDKQLSILGASPFDFGMSRYKASCLISFKFGKAAIQRLIFAHGRTRTAA